MSLLRFWRHIMALAVVTVGGCLAVEGESDSIRSAQDHAPASITLQVDGEADFYAFDSAAGKLIQVTPPLMDFYRSPFDSSFALEYSGSNHNWVQVQKGSDAYFVAHSAIYDSQSLPRGWRPARELVLEAAFECPLLALGAQSRLTHQGRIEAGASVTADFAAGSAYAAINGEGDLAWVSKHCAGQVKLSAPSSFDETNIDFMPEVTNLPLVTTFESFRETARAFWLEKVQGDSEDRCYCAVRAVGCAHADGISGASLLPAPDHIAPIATYSNSGCGVAACDQACNAAKLQLWEHYSIGYETGPLADEDCDPSFGVEFQIMPVGDECGENMLSGSVLGKTQAWRDESSLWN